MKGFIEQHKLIIFGIVCLLFSGIVGASAAVIIFSSSEVSYDNSESGMSSSNVQDAIDELYGVARLSERMDELEETLNDYWKTVYPVGSIYISINSTNPGTTFGGTWVAYGSGKTLVGVDSSDTSFNTVEKSGGGKTTAYTPAGTVGNTTLTVKQIPSHTHNYVKATSVGNHTLTVAEMPSHTHSISNNGNSVVVGHGSGGYTYENSYNNSATNVFPSALSSTGGGGAHNHPLNTSTVASVATGGGAAHNHSFTGTAANISTVQPYITVYMWKRTA